MGAYDATLGIVERCLEFAREASPALIILTLLIILLGSVALLYLLLCLVAPVPRLPLPSEKSYKKILPDGSTSKPQPLPCWFDNHTARKNLSRRKNATPKPTPLEPPEIFMSVVVPAYNEERRLAGMLEEAVEFLEANYGSAGSTLLTNGSTTEPNNKPTRGWEILVISDGSTDATVATTLHFARAHQLDQQPTIATPGPWSAPRQRRPQQQQQPRSGQDGHGSIRVVELEANRGKGGAVVHGLRHVRGAYAVFADADGASRFGDLGKLVEGVKGVEDDEGRGVAIGSRAHLVGSEAVVKRSAIRNFLMHSFHLLLRLMTPPATSRIKDTQCGFKLFSRASLPYIVPYMHSEGWIFDVEMLMLAELGGIPMVEVAVGWKEVMGSKLNVLWDSLGMAWGLAILRLAWAMGVYRTH